MELSKELVSWYSKYKIKKSIKNKWQILMERVNNVDITKDSSKQSSSDFNKKAHYYIVEDIFIKHYGFDAIIVPPYGKSLNDFRKLLPAISIIYRCEVIAEYSSTKSSFYMRCHLEGLSISDIDNIKFKWYQMFTDSKVRNINDETFILGKSEKIYHPTKLDKKNNKLLIGHKFDVSIPTGLSYDSLEDNIVDLNKIFGICSLHFDDAKNKTTIEIMNTKVSDDEVYEPIKVKPWELYNGMTHAYKAIILNFKSSPNVLIGGSAGSGKTISMIMGLLNLVLSNDENLVQLAICMLSDKQDLRMFKNIKHCKYYAKDTKSALKELRYLSREVSRRNKMFDEVDDSGSITNVYEYNDCHDIKLPLIYFCIDEVASFAVNGAEENKGEIDDKNKCNALMWKLAREGRSSGVYCILCTQRGSLTHMSGDVKGNLGNQICFYFPNTASALTILGEGELASLAIRQKKQREFIAVADEIYHGKTLYLDSKMVINYLKPLIEDNKEFMILDNKGNIIKKSENGEENQEKSQEITKNEPKNEEKVSKTIDFTKNIKAKKESKWEKYQKRRNLND
jgi:S-DNA-T family DNA segregation ATPase FtsK/SpoIIIE